MKYEPYRFARPNELKILPAPKLSVAVVIACRGGQEKLDLVLASLAAQSYPSSLISVYIIDDASTKPLVLPKIKPTKTKVIYYKNAPGKWGKTAATNDCVAKLKEDVLWFIDADMIFEADHLAHHMKWHHDNDDYAVLGWKRFVEKWEYTPESLVKSLNAGEFDLLHDESWGKELWESRVSRTHDLEKPGVEGYRAFVGATFSIANKQWRKLGGYDRNFVTAEDTELGWRVFVSGLRTVVDRQAKSWHLGYSAIELNKDLIQRHNDPLLAQAIPQMHSVRAKHSFNWLVPTYQVFLDVRNSNLQQLQDLRSKLLRVQGSNAHFTLLAPWNVLAERYSPINDSHGDLREIRNWVKGDSEYSCEEIATDAQLTIEELISGFTPGSTPFYIFAEASGDFDLKDLVAYLLATENGLVGIANKRDERAFAVFAPALARATTIGAPLYSAIARQWGIHWVNEDQFAEINQGKHNLLMRAVNFFKREGKKINSPIQLFVFIQKLVSLVLRKVFRRG